MPTVVRAVGECFFSQDLCGRKLVTFAVRIINSTMHARDVGRVHKSGALLPEGWTASSLSFPRKSMGKNAK